MPVSVDAYWLSRGTHHFHTGCLPCRGVHCFRRCRSAQNLFCPGRLVLAKATSSQPWKSRPFSFSSAGTTGLLIPNDMENGKKTYSSTLSTTWDHIVHEHWVVDQDPFAMNQLGHPYQGSMFHGFARSAGLNYWEALLYDNVGSYLWKMGGETR